MVALAVFLIFSINSYAQGADCGTSLQMNNIESYCSGTTEFMNAGATPSGLSLPACWAAAATEDVWFKFTAIGSDVLVTVKGSGSGGTMQQPRLAIYTGTCAALTNPGAACNNGTAGLNITANPTAPTICAGNSVVLTASGGTTYDWNPKTNMNPAAGTSASVTVNPTTTTTYTVDGNTNGCTGQGSVTVTVGPPVMATFNPIPDFCTSESAPSLPTLSNEGYVGNWSPTRIYFRI